MRKTYAFIIVGIVAIAGAIYYYAGSRDARPARERFVDIFDEQPSVSCSNLVMTAWSANQLAVSDDLKIAINEIFHSRGITAPIKADEFDDLVTENDGQLKELYTRAENNFYPKCEELMLKFFTDCEHENSNQSGFLKCWVDSSGSDSQKALYRTLTNGIDPSLPDLDGADLKEDSSQDFDD